MGLNKVCEHNFQYFIQILQQIVFTSLGLKADPTMCKVSDAKNIFKLDDIAAHSDGMIKLTVSGRKEKAIYFDYLDFALGTSARKITYGFCKQKQYIRLF